MLDKDRLEALYKEAMTDLDKKKQADNHKYHTSDYNCHGLTCYLHGIVDRLRWIEPDEFHQLINQNSNKDNYTKEFERTKGEILAIAITDYYDSHSAVYIGDGRYIQKKGRGPLEIADLPEIKTTYRGEETTRIKL